MGLFMAGLPSVRFFGKSGGGFRSPSLPPPVLAGSGSKGLGNRPISVHHRLGEGGRPWDCIDLAPGKTEVKEYPGRTEHIHVKVRAPGKAVLTTQLYFPGVARNQEDSIFDAHLLVTVQNMATGKAATFDFVSSS